ncbi:uncharacterized protein PRD47_005611 isoform 1-T1 [Ara ararauna]
MGGELGRGAGQWRAGRGAGTTRAAAAGGREAREVDSSAVVSRRCCEGLTVIACSGLFRMFWLSAALKDPLNWSTRLTLSMFGLKKREVSVFPPNSECKEICAMQI